MNYMYRVVILFLLVMATNLLIACDESLALKKQKIPRISGTVTCTNGAPAAGVTVTAECNLGVGCGDKPDGYQFTTVTASDGSYTLELEPHSLYDVYAEEDFANSVSIVMHSWIPSGRRRNYDFVVASDICSSSCFQVDIFANCWGHHIFKYSPNLGFQDHSGEKSACSCRSDGCYNDAVTISGDLNAVVLSAYGSYGRADFTFYFDDTHTNTGWRWECNGEVTNPPNDLNSATMTPIECE